MGEHVAGDAGRPAGRSRAWAGLLVLAVFLLALLPRVIQPGVSITWDEPKWINRALRFGTALREGDLRETFLVGHPGVTTMWLGSVGMTLGCALKPGGCGDLSDLGAASSARHATEAAMKRLPEVLPAARLALALAIALAITGIYLLARRLLAPAAALLGVVLIATDPFFLAHSRVFQLDALTTVFMMLSLVALLVYLAERRRWALALAAVAAGLAVLSKSSGLFLAPLTALLLLAAAAKGAGPLATRLARSAADLAIWLGVLVVTVFALWPALWVAAPRTLVAVWETGTGYALTAHENLTFFMGRIVEDPGALFYPVAIAFRLSPLVMIGLMSLPLALAWSLLRRGAGRSAARDHTDKPVPTGERMPSGEGRPPSDSTRSAWVAVTLLFFAAAFIVFMSFGAKKFDRYILPVFPALDLAAAVGLAWWAGRVSRKLAGRAGAAGQDRPVGSGTGSAEHRGVVLLPFIALGLICGVQVAAILAHHPYYLAYYNPLLGGGARAVHVLLVGWGEGMDVVADDLNRKPGAEALTAVAWLEPGFTPLFRGHTLNFLEFTSPAQADYVIFYVSDLQRRFHEAAHAIFDRLEPERIVRLNGIEYARVYRNDHARLVEKYLEGQGHKVDAAAILLSEPSVFQRQYAGPLPVYVAATGAVDDPTALDAQLADLARHYPYLWYVDYGGACDAQAAPRYAVTAGDAFVQHDVVPYGTRLIGLRMSVSPLPRSAASDSNDLYRVRFGDALSLRSATIGRGAVESAQAVPVAVSWAAEDVGGRNLSAKLTLEDAEGGVWGSLDQAILGPDCQLTGVWPPETLDQDWYALPVLPGTPPGRYAVRLQVHTAEDAEPLAVDDPRTQGPDHALLLGEVDLLRPSVPPAFERLDIEHPVVADESPALGQEPPTGGDAMAGPRLLGYNLSDLPMRPGDRRKLTLFWRAGAVGSEELNLRLRWLDAEGRVRAEANLPHTAYPTSRWQAGEIVRAQYALELDPTVPGDQAVARIELVGAQSGRAIPGAAATLRPIPIDAPPHRFEPPAQIPHPQTAELGAGARLLGYGLDRPAIAAGENLGLTLFWQARAPMDRNYTVFVHLVDPEGRIAAQADAQPAGGLRPTRGWQAGEFIEDRYVVSTAGAPPGQYRIALGMYDGATGERLAVRGDSDQPAAGTGDGAVILATPVEIR